MDKQTKIEKMQERRNRRTVRLALRLLLIVASTTLLGLLLAPAPTLGACTCQVEGTVTTYTTVSGQHLPIIGVNVYLLVYNFGTFFYVQFQQPNSNPTLTDSNGHFSFQDSYYIQPNAQYYIGINGVPGTLGVSNADNKFGQWFSGVKTDSSGHANVNAQMELGTQVKPPFAALYSNSPDVGFNWSYQQQNTLTNTVTFKVGGTGGTIGYSQSQTETFQDYPATNTQVYLYYLSWGNTFYCSADPSNICSSYYGGTGLLKSGIGGQVIGAREQSYPTSEYLDPATLPSPNTGHVIALSYAPGTHPQSWSETKSNSWSVSLGTQFAIQFMAFSIPVQIDTTFGQSTTSVQLLGATITNSVYKTYEFYPVYTCSDSSAGCASAELHAWDCGQEPNPQNDASGYAAGDAGNSWSAATTIPPGNYNDPLQVLWSPCDTQDWYQFSVTSGQIIKVILTPPSTSAYNQELYDQTGTLMAGVYTQINGYVSTITYTACSSGSWATRAFVASGTSGQGAYTLDVSLSSGGDCSPPPPPPNGSIMAGTQVLMSDGSWKPVQNIAAGMSIRGFNPGSPGSFYDATVTSLVPKSVDNLYVISTDSGNPIRVDYYEQFWVQLPGGQQQWMHAGQVQLGYKIFMPTTGAWATVTSIETDTGNYTVYDLITTPTLPDGGISVIANGYLDKKIP